MKSEDINNAEGGINKPQTVGVRAKNIKDIRGIRITGILFLCIMTVLIIVLVILSNKLSRATKEINLAGRQRMLSQRITKASYNLQIAINAGDLPEVKKTIDELDSSYTLFNDTLLAFKNGGNTTGVDNELVFIKKVQNPQMQQYLSEVYDKWKPITRDVQILLADKVDMLNLDNVQHASKLLHDDNEFILKRMNDLTQALENEAAFQAKAALILQFFALGLVVINFGYLSFFAVRALTRNSNVLRERAASLQNSYGELQSAYDRLESTQEELNTSNSSLKNAISSLNQISTEAHDRANLLEAMTHELNSIQEESDTIFNSVDHGLCLLDSNFKLGAKVSNATFDIFEREELSNMSFLDLMRPLITEKDHKTLESFLKLQFKTTTLDKQLEKYNPLKKIEVTLDWDGAHFRTKQLSFEFGRIVNKGEVESLLVTITDISETVALENKLKRASEQQEKKTALLMEIMHGGDISQLKTLLSQSEEQLDQINDTLKTQGVSEKTGEAVSEEIIDTVFRKVHNIKGNSAMLGLDSMVKSAHSVETELTKLKDKNETVDGEEFLNSIVSIASMRELLNEYNETIHTVVNEFAINPNTNQKPPTGKPHTVAEQFEQDLISFNKNTGKEHGKTLYTHCALEIDDMAPESVAVLKDVMIQLCRNSVVHGIEQPDARVKQGKLRHGTLGISVEKDKSSSNKIGEPAYICKVRDDGNGLDAEKIKERALKQGLISVRQAGVLSKAEIIKFIFKPNFSTAESLTEHAGRGVGMDIIKDSIINKLGGRLSVSFTPGQYTQISFEVPMNRMEAKTPR